MVHFWEFGRIWAAWAEVFGCIIVALSVVGGQQLEAAQLQTAAAPSRPVHRPVQQLELAAAAARGGGMLWETLVSPALTHASSPCHAASWSMIIFNWNFLDNFSWPSLIAQTYWWWCGKERFGRLLLWFDIFTRSWVEGFFSSQYILGRKVFLPMNFGKLSTVDSLPCKYFNAQNFQFNSSQRI